MASTAKKDHVKPARPHYVLGSSIHSILKTLCGLLLLQATAGSKLGVIPAGAGAAGGQVCGAASVVCAGQRGALAPHH